MFTEMQRFCRGALPGCPWMTGVVDNLTVHRHPSGKYGMLDSAEDVVRSLEQAPLTQSWPRMTWNWPWSTCSASGSHRPTRPQALDRTEQRYVKFHRLPDQRY